MADFNWLCLALFRRLQGPNRLLFSQSAVNHIALLPIKLSLALITWPFR